MARNERLEPGAAAAWIVEIEKRARELADGSVAPVDWDKARQRIMRRLHEKSA